jgi:hypothetical protein
MAIHPEPRPATAAELRDLLTGAEAPEANPELGTAASAWRAAAWENAGLIALVGLLLLLAVLATWQTARPAPAEVFGTTTPTAVTDPGLAPGLR